MIKKIIQVIIFILSLIIFMLCLVNSSFSFTYTIKSGKKPYYTKVSEKMIIINYNNSVKSVKYCFTTNSTCDDYLDYSINKSDKIITVKIDYPEYEMEQHICIKVENENDEDVYCNPKYYHVDNSLPVIEKKYETVILDKSKKFRLEDFYDVSSSVGISSFKCSLTDKTIATGNIGCKAVSNNGLSLSIDQKVYYDQEFKLEGKKIAFFGDSITAAIKDGFRGYAGRAGLANYMDWYNFARSGAKITNSNNQIIEQIQKEKNNDYDYIILQGGINDARDNVELGEISSSFEVEDFSERTFAGSLETLFYYTKKYNPNSTIGFIITYQTPNSNWTYARDREDQVELVSKICKKWEIPYLDLYDGVVYESGKTRSYSDILKVNTGGYFYYKNDVHLTPAGYDIISKYVSIWLKTL